MRLQGWSGREHGEHPAKGASWVDVEERWREQFSRNCATRVRYSGEVHKSYDADRSRGSAGAEAARRQLRSAACGARRVFRSRAAVAELSCGAGSTRARSSRALKSDGAHTCYTAARTCLLGRSPVSARRAPDTERGFEGSRVSPAQSCAMRAERRLPEL